MAIDRSRYFLVPKTGGRRLLSLGRLLRKYQPENASYDVEETGKLLEQTIVSVTAAFVQRHRESGPSIAAAEAELDTVMDTLWYILRDRTLHWGLFERPGIQRLAAEQEQGDFDYQGCVEKAALAARVRRLLLDQGLDFLRLSYSEQSEHMLTLWTVVEQEQLQEPLAQLIGKEFFGALVDCRARYDQMIEARTAREQGSAVNLRVLSLQLARAIQNYVIALLAMIRDDDPENVETIRKALRPVDALREQLERERNRGRSSTGEPLEPLEPVDEAAVEELLAEQQAIDAELGLLPDEQLPSEDQAPAEQG
ncbi:MAG: hypothetical protein R6X02_09785 [Enhygromyxa sp.]